MPYSVQNALDHARIPLNDLDKDRYSDATLLSYFNDALLLTRKTRPDLFLGKWATLPANLVVGDLFPVDEVYFPYFADYVTGRAETVDDENIESSRAGQFIQSFMIGLKT